MDGDNSQRYHSSETLDIKTPRSAPSKNGWIEFYRLLRNSLEEIGHPVVQADLVLFDGGAQLVYAMGRSHVVAYLNGRKVTIELSTDDPSFSLAPVIKRFRSYMKEPAQPQPKRITSSTPSS